jgi:hypothetical protein
MEEAGWRYWGVGRWDGAIVHKKKGATTMLLGLTSCCAERIVVVVPSMRMQ